MTAQDDVWPEWDPRPHRPPRVRKESQGNPSVSTRFEPEALARLDQFGRRTGMDRATVVRAGVDLLITGYPALPADVHDWLLRLAAANDLDADPQAALVHLVRHLAARRPFAGTLRH